MPTLSQALEGGVLCCQSSAYLLNVTLRLLGLWLEDQDSGLRKSSSCTRRPTSLFPYLLQSETIKENQQDGGSCLPQGAKPFPNTWCFYRTSSPKQPLFSATHDCLNTGLLGLFLTYSSPIKMNLFNSERSEGSWHLLGKGKLCASEYLVDGFPSRDVCYPPKIYHTLASLKPYQPLK